MPDSEKSKIKQMFWVNNHLVLNICIASKQTKNHEDKKHLISVNNID